MTYLIGIDVGTSGTKGLLIDSGGKVHARASASYPLTTPKPLWVEQDPEDWWRATVDVCKNLLKESGVKADQIKGIGLTGQMHGLVILDRNNKVLRPCILWNDQRSGEECAAITSKIGGKRLLEITGNPVLPGFTAPKILWVRTHEPEIYRQIAHVLLPKDYIRFRLTGEFVSDVSDASGMSVLNVRGRTWAGELLDELEIPRSWMPAVVESPAVSARVNDAAATETGLAKGTPVVGGAGDNAAGAVGSGVVRPGVLSVSIGTSGVLFAHSDQYRIEPEGRLHSFCHAVPGAWHLMGVTLSAGGSLRWFRDTFCESETTKARQAGKDPYELMMEEANSVAAGSEGLLFLPYLTGERTPYPDPHARGSFVGLTIRHTKAHLIRSVLEGVAFSLRDCLELMKALGLKIDTVRATGGGARSPVWLQIIADVFNAEIATVSTSEGTSFGAALLAGVGAGVFPSAPEASEQTVKVVSSVQPNKSNVSAYEEMYRIYHSSYHALKPLTDPLSGNMKGAPS